MLSKHHFKMITSALFMAIVIPVLYSSCIKDRLQQAVLVVPPPVNIPPVDTIPVSTDTALHLLDYWDFNTNDTSTLLMPTFATGSAAITYVSNYFDDVNPGSSFNVRNGDTTGDALRMRNPFTSVTFLFPTTGYKNPVFTFAAQRSSNGPSVNNIFYTIDGINFINDSLLTTSISLDTAWAAYKVDFTGVKRVSNNAKFAIQFISGNNNTGTSGNDRYDNVALDAYKQ